MAQQEGPFSEYLQQIKITPPVQVPKPTGLEGTGSAIGNIALNFISGLRQGRQQQYMQQEMEEQKKFDAYQKAMERVSASKLPDAEKRSLYAELEKPLIQRIASDPNATSKKTGNPLTDLFKSVASSVAGPAPKKRMNLEMDPVMNALQAVSDPTRQVPYLGAQLDRQAELIIRQITNAESKAGRAVSLESFLSGENGQLLADVMDKARVLGYDLQAIKRLYSETKLKTTADYKAEKDAQDELAGKNILKTGVSKIVETPPNKVSATGTELAQATNGQPLPAAKGSPGSSPGTDSVDLSTAKSNVITQPSASGIEETKVSDNFINIKLNSLNEVVAAGEKYGKRKILENPEEMMVDGKRLMGQIVTGLPVDGNPVNGFLVGGKLYTEGFRKPTTYDVKAPQADVDKVYGSSLKSIEGIVSDKKSLGTVKTVLDGYRDSGNIPAMHQLVSSQLILKQRRDDQLTRDSLKAVTGQAAKDKQFTNAVVRQINDAGKDPLVVEFRRLGPKVDSIKASFGEYFQAVNAAKSDPNNKEKVAIASEKAAILDNLLINNIAVFADAKTGVRDKERELWKKLEGLAGQLNIKLLNFTGNRNDQLSQEGRGEIYSYLNQVLKSYQSGISGLMRDRRNASLSIGEVIGVDPATIERSASAWDNLAIGGASSSSTTSPPPAANKTKTAEPGTI